MVKLDIALEIHASWLFSCPLEAVQMLFYPVVCGGAQTGFKKRKERKKLCILMVKADIKQAFEANFCCGLLLISNFFCLP